MQEEKTTKDKLGNLVKAGDTVRLTSIEWSGMKELDAQEQDDLRSMIGEVFTIEEIDEFENAWITKCWDRGNGKSECHSLALSPVEMERIDGSCS